jgi:uncharacterized protein HemX
MTDNQQNESTTAAVTASNLPQENPTAGSAPPPRSGRGVAWLAVLLSLLVGGGGGYLWYQFDLNRKSQDARMQQALEQIVQQREADIKDLKSQLTTQKNAAETLKSETETLKGQNQTQAKEGQSLRDGINNLQTEIKDLQGSITTLKGEVEIHKGGVEIQKADTQNLIAHVRNLQTDIQNLQDAVQKLQGDIETQRGNYEIHKSAIQALQQDLQSLTGNLQALKEQVENSTAERQKMLAEVDNRIQNLQLAQRNLLTTLDNVKVVVARGGDINAFPLSEVEYLLRLADYQLRFQQDIPGAVNALTEADQRLAAVDEEAFSGVRQMIQENIASLHGVNLPDRSALAHKLLEMEGRLSSLPLRAEGQIEVLKEKVKPHDVRTAPGDTEQPWWQRFALLAKEQFKDVIVIRRTRSNEPPLIAVQEEYFLLQNLRMELEAMRIALLGNDVSNYLESDAIAQKWIKTYFNTEDKQVADLLAELETLKNLNLNPYIPTVSTTLRAFLEVMQTRKPVRSVSMPAPSGKSGEAKP